MIEPVMMDTSERARVLVACPDARPPAYQAVVGLSRAESLDQFVTAYYHRGTIPFESVARRIAPDRLARLNRALCRRHDPEIPSDRVRSVWSYDVALRIENKLARSGSAARPSIVRWRTRAFDRLLARRVDRARPDAALIFSDVGSEFALPRCRRLGIPTALSMVHGEVNEERAVLDREREASPEFFPIYLGDGALDLDELAWLHDRRRRDLELADRVLVPSEHIARAIIAGGTDEAKVRVIPYAADCRRFRPDPTKRPGENCTFLFAGGITQRKGIKYLLEAWRAIKRPGWRLQLLGPLPYRTGPLEPYLDEVELLGRVAHAEMPARMAEADVFVFPSLFEGSAVVTYEALACGLPSVVTPNAGSVVRDGVEGFLVGSGDVEALARRMEQLGSDPELRATFAIAARTRAEAFDWPRYHDAVNCATLSLCSPIHVEAGT
jgi:alpha-maltose-1-phosphate synthase